MSEPRQGPVPAAAAAAERVLAAPGGREPAASTAAGRGDGWSEELRANHLALSAADLEFREAARQDQDLLRRSTFSILDGDARLYYRQQPWPTFVGRARMEELKRVSLAVAALIRRVPERIFHNDPARLCSFYGLPSRDAAELILAEPNCLAESMARGDLIDTAGGFKCIEFNFSPDVGGWETSLLADLQRQIPATADLLLRAGVRFTYTSTLEVMFAHVIRQAERRRICDRGERNVLNVACVFDPVRLAKPGLAEMAAVFQRDFDASCRQAGSALHGRVIACQYRDLIPAQGRLFCGKMQVHAVFELAAGQVLTEAFRCFKAGKILLFNGPISHLLSEKRNLALLSENAAAGAFSPPEQEIIRRHIPWTRLVAAGPVEIDGETVQLPDLLAAARHRLVLKEGRSFGGKGGALGAFTPAARWEELVRTALDKGGWVVQERLESLPYLYQCGDFGCAPHDVIWGPFVVGDAYAGVILRMQPKTAGGAVNLSLAATEGVVFEV